MKISKRTREQAWLICAIAASNPDDGMSNAEFCLGIEEDAPFNLARAAWLNAAWRYPEEFNDTYQVLCAEAAMLLAEGWCPP